MLRRLIREDIDLIWKPGPDLWSVRMDPTQIHQILANLAANARDAIESVGHLTIQTQNVSFDTAYCMTHTGFTPGRYVSLEVSDDGRGMDEETKAHIFEPFYTTKAEGQGTGLGLATVYGVVQQNDGLIDMQSEVGRGTTVRIFLPRVEDETARVAKQAQTEDLQSGTETVLLVEDEPMVLRLSKRSLERLGYKVLPASTPSEAIRLSNEHAGTIDLLVTDVVMPEMNGRDLADRLSSVDPNLKKLFVSGYSASALAPRGVLDDGVHFLQKPFSLTALAAKVREVLEA
jgi:CheY-like chemotaxis protein